jgi:hypothetical protein
MQSCEPEDESDVSESDFKCKGIFTTHAHGDHKDSHSLYEYHQLPQLLHLTEDEKAKPVMFFLCEGTTSFYTMSVQPSEHQQHHGGKEPSSSVHSLRKATVQQSSHESGGTVGTMQFYMCVGEMKFLTRAHTYQSLVFWDSHPTNLSFPGTVTPTNLLFSGTVTPTNLSLPGTVTPTNISFFGTVTPMHWPPLSTSAVRHCGTDYVQSVP